MLLTLDRGLVPSKLLLEPENLEEVLKRVNANKGSAGVDRMSVDDQRTVFGRAGKRFESIVEWNYKPQPVLRVENPKPAGRVWKVGIPVVLDRWIQQAVMLCKSAEPSLTAPAD